MGEIKFVYELTHAAQDTDHPNSQTFTSTLEQRVYAFGAIARTLLHHTTDGHHPHSRAHHAFPTEAIAQLADMLIVTINATHRDMAYLCAADHFRNRQIAQFPQSHPAELIKATKTVKHSTVTFRPFQRDTPITFVIPPAATYGPAYSVACFLNHLTSPHPLAYINKTYLQTLHQDSLDHLIQDVSDYVSQLVHNPTTAPTPLDPPQLPNLHIHTRTASICLWGYCSHPAPSHHIWSPSTLKGTPRISHRSHRTTGGYAHRHNQRHHSRHGVSVCG